MPEGGLASRAWVLALITFALALAVHLPFTVLVRYRIPFVEPVALLYAGAALGDGEPPRSEPEQRR